MSTTHKFDLQARERFLALIAVGRNLEEAAVAAGTSRQTVARWAARGRALGASAEHAAFAERLEQARAEAREATVAEREAERWLWKNVLKSAAKKAGVPWAGFHTFRHTCASILFAEGRNPKQVQMWLGHSDPGFTIRTYVHLIDDGLGDADFFDAATWARGGATCGATRGTREQANDAPAEARKTA